MRESSGSVFYVMKEAHGDLNRRRLRAQWEWLREHHLQPGIVDVYDWHENVNVAWYEMEYLRPATLRGPGAVRAIVRILRDEVWCGSARLDTIQGASVISKYPDVSDWWRKLPMVTYEDMCDTHGDPTVENTMERDGATVLIDPLPDATCSWRVPSIPALDLGKLLQSALGYEDVKRGWKDVWQLDVDMAHEVRAAARDKTEWERACCLCLLHVHRLIPYQNAQLMKRWTSWLPDITRSLRLISTEY